MTFLIDGYNLLYAVGWAHRGMTALEPARRKLLDWLAGFRVEGVEMIVVFDSNRGTGSRGNHRGITVRYTNKLTADDEIEEILAALPQGKGVTVVSNDMRLHESARRAGATAWRNEQLLDWFERDKGKPQVHTKETVKEKPDAASEREINELFNVFKQPKKRN